MRAARYGGIPPMCPGQVYPMPHAPTARHAGKVAPKSELIQIKRGTTGLHYIGASAFFLNTNR